MQPFEVLAGFIDAARRGDEASAEALSTPAGWASDGDSARRAWRNLRKDILFTPLDLGNLFGDRYVIAGLLSSADRQRRFGDLYFLLRRDGDGPWRLEGATKHMAVAALFARGCVSGVPSWRDLPASDDARYLGEAVLARLAASTPGLDGVAVRADASASTRGCLDDLLGRAGSVIAAVACAPLGRELLGMSFARPNGDRPEERWLIFDRSSADGALVVHSHSLYGSLEALTAGVGAGIFSLAPSQSGGLVAQDHQDA